MKKDGIYHRYTPEFLPWELRKPRKIRVDLILSKCILPGKALDPCCGAGTNSIYMAQNGFDVTALDVSHKAVEYQKNDQLTVCFSDKNGSAWNHFTENQIVELFRNQFRILWIKHSSSIEGDNVTRHFYEAYMKKGRIRRSSLIYHRFMSFLILIICIVW